MDENRENEQLEETKETEEAVQPETEAVPEKETESLPENEGGEESAADEAVPADAPAEEKELPQEEKKDYVFRWDYSAQKEYDEKARKKEKKSGVWVYIAVTSVIFVLSLAMLLGAVLLTKNNVKEDYSTAEVADAVLPSVVLLTTGSSSGSGVIISSDGYIITNYHLISSGSKIAIRLYNDQNKEISAEVVGYDEDNDVAVLKIDRIGLPAAVIGNSNDLVVGEKIIALGNHGGTDYPWTVTEGVVSYLRRTVKVYDETYILTKKLTAIQISAAVNNGCSGGPITNTRGEVVGIIAMKASSAYDGIGFALPINGVMKLVNDIIQQGNADSSESGLYNERPVLGITGVAVAEGNWYRMEENTRVTLSEEEAAGFEDSFYADTTGIMVLSVNQGCDAEAKFRVNDVIISINGITTPTMYHIGYAINDFNVGDRVYVTVVREGKETTFSVELSSLPKQE